MRIWSALLVVLLAGSGWFVFRTQSPQGQVPTQPAISQTETIASDATIQEDTPATQTITKTTASGNLSASIDIHAIPLGDGKVSTIPKAGYVYSCQTSFRGGGAEHAGDWIQGNTWDLSKKIQVQGKVYWDSALFSSAIQGAMRVLTGNGLPVKEPTGTFPIAKTDPAYQIDRNPNSIKTQSLSYSLPANPAVANSASCVPMGAIGVALDGVAIYNALDDGGRDAVAHEVQDLCNGHPQQQGEYHYHGPSPCMPHSQEKNALVGYALDGFGIYSMYDANGKEYTNADLDACHGITSEIEWNGKKVTMYHYVLTQEYPYTIGCFHGTPVSNGLHGGGTQSTGQQGGTPPQEAITACTGKQSGASCSVGPGSGTCRTTPDGSFACVPTR